MKTLRHAMALLTVLVLAGLAAAPVRAQAQVKEDMLRKIEAGLPEKATATPAKSRKALVYTYAAGFVHSSIPVGAKAVELMGKKTGAYASVTSNDPAAFDDLTGFDAIVLVNTTGDWLVSKANAKADEAKRDARRKNILDFLSNGGGLVGFHAATDSQNNWKEFGAIMGGYFDGHPWHEKVGVKLEEPNHPLLAAFGGKDFEIVDEIYQLRDPYSRATQRILLRLDLNKTNLRKGGIKRKDGDFGVSWIREYGKGHVFYSSLGHREEIFWNPVVLRYYLDGIQFAMGDFKAPAEPSPPVPAAEAAAANTAIEAARLQFAEEDAKKKAADAARKAAEEAKKKAPAPAPAPGK